jgi:hypothetical protein
MTLIASDFETKFKTLLDYIDKGSRLIKGMIRIAA